MADTLATILDATFRALRLKYVAAAGGADAPDNLQDCLDGDRLRVNISDLPGGASALTWAALTLQNSWVSYDAATYITAQYAKSQEGVVHIRGMIKNGTAAAGTLLATLPAGFRPTKIHTFAIVADSVTEVIDIQPDGDIILATAASSTWLSLSGIHFSVDA